MGDLTYTDHADMHYMYARVNGNGKTALRMQFPDQRMPCHRIFQLLHSQLREIRSFHFTRYDADRRRAVRSPSLEESILNVAAGKQARRCLLRKCEAVCRVLNENRLHLFHFQQISELIAIDEALRIIKAVTSSDEIWILCDSRSAIQHLSDWTNVGDKTSVSILKKS
ncbi:hypothetical protein TNCV_3069891 [Trichonephila clavipes]|nr:hypothetical protein TNCV_3069891 [Trichonephila clavipes]